MMGYVIILPEVGFEWGDSVLRGDPGPVCLTGGKFPEAAAAGLWFALFPCNFGNSSVVVVVVVLTDELGSFPF
jgi:hypothetical protein